MKLLNRNFTFGFFTGIIFFIILCVFIVIIGRFLGKKILEFRVEYKSQEMSNHLKPPFLSNIETFEYNFKINQLNGDVVSLENIKNKVIFLSFLSTTCSTCLSHLSNIQNLYYHFKNDPNIVFLIVISDPEITRAKNLILNKKYAFPTYYFENNLMLTEFKKIYNAANTYIISKEGKILVNHKGSAEWDNKTVIEYIEKIL